MRKGDKQGIYIIMPHAERTVHACRIIYRIAGIFRGGKFSRKPLQLYYSNYSRAEFSRNAPSSAKNYPFCTELTVRATLCNHTLARHLFAG